MTSPSELEEYKALTELLNLNTVLEAARIGKEASALVAASNEIKKLSELNPEQSVEDLTSALQRQFQQMEKALESSNSNRKKSASEARG